MMRRLRLTLSAVAWLALCAGTVKADDATGGASVAACIVAASDIYRLPPALLLILLRVEGGSLGRVSLNTNGTVDIGPMQVNQLWLPKLARHWNASEPATFAALRDDFCANIEGGAWILWQAMNETRGDFWEGVGRYHSHEPGYKAAYLRQVLKQALRLQEQATKIAARDSRVPGD